MTNNNELIARNAKTTAQLACELIAASPEGIDLETMLQVLAFAQVQEVAPLYIDCLLEVIDQEVTRRDDADRI